MVRVTQSDQSQGSRKLLSRTERRAQLIQAAATAFAAAGFAATGLDDVAVQAGVTRAIIYRHFASKDELYRAVLDDTQARLRSRVGSPDTYTPDTVEDLVGAACENPDGFRLLFRHAQREPEFAESTEERSRLATRITEVYLRETQPDDRQRRWLAELIPKVTIELILSWLEADRPTSETTLIETIRATTRALSRGL
jgi:AcrR family transcriptional regulator